MGPKSGALGRGENMSQSGMVLVHIIIGPEAGKPLQYVKQVLAIKGRGLEGDRYFFQKGTFNKAQLDQTVREVSIIPYESLEECNSRLGTKLGFLDLRRNLVIKGFDIDKVGDQIFLIGETKFRVVRTCPPCRYLSRLLGEDMMQGLKYIGGYRAIVVKSGTIVCGDSVTLT